MLVHEVHDDADDSAISIRADPTGLAIDRQTGVLYVADAGSGAILRVEHDPRAARRHRIATVADVGAHRAATAAVGPVARRSAPALVGARGASPVLVGALALTPFGSVFASRASDSSHDGRGRDDGAVVGTLVRIEPDGHLEVFDRLERGVHRLGVTCDVREHALYATQFRTSRFGAHDGSIVAVDLVTGEPSTLLDGFAMPIGIAKLGDTLVVADARQRAVFRVDLRAGRAIQRLQLVGDLGRPHSICACTHDSVLVTSFDPELGRGAVRRLWLDGRTRGIGSGAWDPAGVATDGKRVFVAARRANRVLVFPLG